MNAYLFIVLDFINQLLIMKISNLCYVQLVIDQINNLIEKLIDHFRKIAF